MLYTYVNAAWYSYLPISPHPTLPQPYRTRQHLESNVWGPLHAGNLQLQAHAWKQVPPGSGQGAGAAQTEPEVGWRGEERRNVFVCTSPVWSATFITVDVTFITVAHVSSTVEQVSSYNIRTGVIIQHSSLFNTLIKHASATLVTNIPRHRHPEPWEEHWLKFQAVTILGYTI